MKQQKTKELLLKIIKKLGQQGKLNLKQLYQQGKEEQIFETLDQVYVAYATLQRSGYLEEVRPQSTKSLVRITHKGLQAAGRYQAMRQVLRQAKHWDGYWRLVIFDIPEDVNLLRDGLRNLLKKLGFKMLQASVWVYPYDIFDQLERLIPDIKRHGWIKLLVAKEVIGIGPADLKKKFDLEKF